VSATPLAEEGKSTSSRTTALILTAACCIAVGWAAAPAPLTSGAEAASSRVADVGLLGEGVGMGARPSVRVRRVQRILDRRGFDLGRPGVDGRFGPLTAAAVRRMQVKYHLVGDGIVGPRTRRVLHDIASALRERTAARKHADSARRSGSPDPRVRSPQSAGRGRHVPATHPPESSHDGRGARGAGSRADVIDRLAPLLGIAAILAAGGLAATVLARRRPSDPRALRPTAAQSAAVNRHGAGPRRGPVDRTAIATAVPYGGDGDRQPEFLVEEANGAPPAWVSRSHATRPAARLEAGDPVIGYVPAAGDRRDRDRAVAAIRSRCAAAGWRLQQIMHEHEPPGAAARPALAYALAQVAAGRAQALVATDSPSRSRSPADPGVLVRCRRAGAALVLVDPDAERSASGDRQTVDDGRLRALEGDATRRPPRLGSGHESVTPSMRGPIDPGSVIEPEERPR